MENNMGDENKKLYFDLSDGPKGQSEGLKDQAELKEVWDGSQEDFYKSIIRNQQDDIGKIGRYFRDELAQELYGMRISLQNFTNRYGDFEELRCLRDSLSTLVMEIRNKAVLLYNPILNDLGIFHAVDEVVASYKKRSGFTIDTLLDPHLRELHQQAQVHLFKLLTAIFQYLNDEIPSQAISISVQVIEFDILIKVSPFFQQGEALSISKLENSPMRLMKIAKLYNARIMNDTLAAGILLKLTI
jgi:signal transduction histidine kinase